MKKPIHLPLASLVVLSLFYSARPAQIALAVPATTVRVSVASDGTQADNHSHSSSISSDGRYVAFHSFAGNLVSEDWNGTADIFVHDRTTGETTRVSVDTGGMEGNNQSIDPSISSDGRYVAFRSSASNLISQDTNHTSDIFVHDRTTGETTRVSEASDNTEGNKDSYAPSISPDGRYVAFSSYATNLVSEDANNAVDIFVHDRTTGETTRVSVATGGTEGNNNSFAPSISLNGTWVAFESVASNLVPGDANGAKDVFVHSLVDGVTTRVSVASGGTPGGSISDAPSISSDGRHVAFRSYSSNLIPDDTNGKVDIFVHDLTTGDTTRVSVASDGTAGNNNSEAPSISSDGRYVAFHSSATNLVSDDTSAILDVFVHDRMTGATKRVSVASDGTEGITDSVNSSISSDGCCVAFESNAYNLVSEDTGPWWDIFVHADAVQAMKTLRSEGTHDGYVLESTETSGVGGTMDSASTTLRLGDDAARRQYRSILSFATVSLPDNALISMVTLQVKRQGVVGSLNPVTAFKGFMLDIRRGAFGNVGLQTTDWQAVAGRTLGPISPALAGGWYTFNLTSAKAFINRLATGGGVTQIRLRFNLDDNNNTAANYLSLYSGNYLYPASRPTLIINYYIP